MKIIGPGSNFNIHQDALPQDPTCLKHVARSFMYTPRKKLGNIAFNKKNIMFSDWNWIMCHHQTHIIWIRTQGTIGHACCFVAILHRFCLPTFVGHSVDQWHLLPHSPRQRRQTKSHEKQTRLKVQMKSWWPKTSKFIKTTSNNTARIQQTKICLDKSKLVPEKNQQFCDTTVFLNPLS